MLLKDFNVFDDEQLKRAVSRSNLVINLLGMDKETMNFSFEDVHIEAAKKVATAAANNGQLERFLHVSCLAAASDHPSRRMRTKVTLPDMSMFTFPFLCPRFSASDMDAKTSKYMGRPGIGKCRGAGLKRTKVLLGVCCSVDV